MSSERTTVLVNINIAGLNLKDSNTKASQAWDSFTKTLKTSEPNPPPYPNHPASVCGRDKKSPDELLLMVEGQSQTQVLFALQPLIPLLSTPPHLLIIPSNTITTSPGHCTQQLTFYLSPSASASQLSNGLTQKLYPYEHRGIIRNWSHAEILSSSPKLEWQGERCKGVILFLEWSVSRVLGVDEGEREGDEEILKNGSIKSDFVVDGSMFLGVEERNWDIQTLESFGCNRRQEGEKGWGCICM